MSQAAILSAASDEAFDTFLMRRKSEFNTRLTQLFSKPWKDLTEAMMYSLHLPSKRIRPLFCLEVAKAISGQDEMAFPAAAALEMVHTYSLVHDDLPAMDNDDLRRGMPTNHKKFGEARAILVGDALLTKAFEVLATEGSVSAQVRVNWVRELAFASGMEGMVLGQDLDMYPPEGLGTDKADRLRQLEYLHRRKTGALFGAAVVMGAMACEVGEEWEAYFRQFASDLGLAFQIQDDVLDVIGGQELGKPLKSDEKNSKETYVSLLGLESAKEQADFWLQKSIQQLNQLPLTHPHRLEEMVRFVVLRKA